MEIAGKTVLIVDDEKAIRNMLWQMMKIYEAEDVLLASDGIDGLEMLDKGKIDLVLTDNTMPKLTGIGMIECIRNSQSSVPIILMTGYAVDGIEKEALKAGANKVMFKPIDLKELIKIIKEL